MAPQEYLPVLLALGGATARTMRALPGRAQHASWTVARRWQEVAAALDVRLQNLDDDQAYHPEVLDVRGSLALLDEAERAEMEAGALPYFAQVWALGFMFVWRAGPRNGPRRATRTLPRC